MRCSASQVGRDGDRRGGAAPSSAPSSCAAAASENDRARERGGEVALAEWNGRIASGSPVVCSPGVVSSVEHTMRAGDRGSGGRSVPRMCESYDALEPVAHLPHRDDVARVRRIHLELPPQLGDVRVHRAREDERAVAPHLLQQLLPRDDAPSARDERQQQLERLRRERARARRRGTPCAPRRPPRRRRTGSTRARRAGVAAPRATSAAAARSPAPAARARRTASSRTGPRRGGSRAPCPPPRRAPRG